MLKPIAFAHNNPVGAQIVLAALMSTVLLLAALVAQYGFDLHPCELCIAQRVPYALVVVVAMGAWGVKPSTAIQKKLAWLCIGLLLVDFGIAFYHSGVELHWFPGPSGCTNNDKAGATIEEMREALRHAQLVPCDQPMAYVLGLSMASWNALAAMASAVVVALLPRKIARHV